MDRLFSKDNFIIHQLLTNQNQITEQNHTIIPRRAIRTLTYNIFERPLIKTNESDWKQERLDEFIKHLNFYDIICLQEMFGSLNNRKDQIIKKALEAGFYFIADIPPPSFFSKSIVDGGLLILSRFPILDNKFYPFTSTVLSDHISQKGIQYCKIQVIDSILHIFNTHLQASYNGTSEFDMNLSINTRKDHLKRVVTIIKEYMVNISNLDTIILLGDFNVNSRSIIKTTTNDDDIKNDNDIKNDEIKEINEIKDVLETNVI